MNAQPSSGDSEKSTRTSPKKDWRVRLLSADGVHSRAERKLHALTQEQAAIEAKRWALEFSGEEDPDYVLE